MTDSVEAAWNTMPEKELQARLEHLMRELRQPYFHDNFSRQNNAGLPDLIVPVPPVLYVPELKATAGRVTPVQSLWLMVLGACHEVRPLIVRPADYETFRDEILVPSWQARHEAGWDDDVSRLHDAIDIQRRAGRARKAWNQRRTD